jgi:hypothetical protein
MVVVDESSSIRTNKKGIARMWQMGMKIWGYPKKKVVLVSDPTITFECKILGYTDGVISACIPHSDDTIPRARNNVAAIGRECNRIDSTSMTLEWSSNDFARACIPHSNGVVLRTRNDVGAIGGVDN